MNIMGVNKRRGIQEQGGTGGGTRAEAEMLEIKFEIKDTTGYF